MTPTEATPTPGADRRCHFGAWGRWCELSEGHDANHSVPLTASPAPTGPLCAVCGEVEDAAEEGVEGLMAIHHQDFESGDHEFQPPPEDESPEPLRERIERLARALAVSAHGAGREGMPAPPRDSIDRIVSAIDRLVAEEMSKAARLANAAEAYGRTYPEDEAIGREFWSALTAYREAQR